MFGVSDLGFHGIMFVLFSAFAVINEDGSVTRLNPNNKTQREAVAKQLLTPGATIGSTTLSATKKVCVYVSMNVVYCNKKTVLIRFFVAATTPAMLIC